MKKCHCYCGPAYYRMCLQTFTVQNKPAAENERSTHHFFVSEWQKKNCRCSQNLWRRRNVVKTETQQTFVNGLLGFITLGIYTRWKRVYCSQYDR